ncbi:28 kDa ribonucleoprotein, chloroplastic-like [Syzygium oleosum]|uniref:28 kDa ribonucleoprotein, chloroplastic-like n=1 Tax=Syzygium oleosum TaxID=219896 RepID=UPI0011D2BDCB|nr:28 kDa ribonucleoprotein, chloroplastic-like [Syzygium oleosum]
MAAAAAAMSSAFSSSINALKCCLHSATSPSSCPPQQLRLPAPSPSSPSSSNLPHRGDALSVRIAPLRRRAGMRISAAVAQEEVAAPAAAEVEKEEEEEEVKEGEGAEGVTVNTKLYFGNLPYNVDSAQLAGIIQDYGSPELVEVLYDRDTGRSRGFAFVTMSSIEDCNAVIQNLDGSEYMGRTLRVNFSDKPKPKEPLYPETDYKLFVGNLSWSVTSESLTKAFQEYGNVVGARVLYDGETGRSRGYGFVSYSTKSEMETAIESLNGVELEGRAMRVSLAEGKRT